MTDFSTENMTPNSGPGPFPPRVEERPMAGGGPGLGGLSSANQANGVPRRPDLQPEVKGRINIADEVVEKVGGLAAMEVEGVADLGGDVERVLENVRERIGIGQKRGDQGIKAKVTGREVSINVTIVVEYGHVVMDVARRVQSNVAIQTNRMLGLTVAEVNVTVDDVKLPNESRDEESPYPSTASTAG